MTTKSYKKPNTSEYDIGGKITLVMTKGRKGYFGHYFRNDKPRAIITFDGANMTKKQILRKFWDFIK